jgi:hypothetical protein
MKKSIRGWKLPESQGDFELLKAAHETRYTNCVECGAGFTGTNVVSCGGWQETQLSGICEKCLDPLFEEESDDDIPF